MCHPARCRTCGKTTWTGCGKHVDDVRVQVPDDLWCAGHDDRPDFSATLRKLLGM